MNTIETDVSVTEKDMFISALQGKPASSNDRDTRMKMMSIVDVVSLLNREQQEDFLVLYAQWHCIFPEESQSSWYTDIWAFLALRTPEEFLEYYRFCAKKRETQRWVTAIIEKTNQA